MPQSNFGYKMDYDSLLQISGLNSLSDRRDLAFRKFTAKTVKNLKYSHCFPERPSIRNTRFSAQYLEETAVGNKAVQKPLILYEEITKQQ